MNSSYFVRSSVSVAIAVLLAGCATWNDMDRQEKGTAVGATGGAVVGAVVGGPVGAAVGAGVGGYAGHYETEPGGIAAKPNNTGRATTTSTGNNAVVTSGYSPDLVRSAQQSLNDKGYNVGAVDGQLGPATRTALTRFQQAQGLAQTGDLDSQTLSALGVSQYDNGGSTAAPSAYPPPNNPPR